MLIGYNHPEKRHPWIAAAIALLVLAAPLPARDESGPDQAGGQGKRPNILFIFTDDHASHAISAYGSRINRTPNLDRLADEGMLFRNCFCTNSICAPSRAVILTGKHSHANGVIDNRVTFDGSQPTFPKMLQEAGYQTAMIGKWHLKSNPTGFDHWEVLPGQGQYYNPDFKTAEGMKRYTGYVTDITTDLAMKWLSDQRDPDKPFMLMCQHKAPHRNWQPGPKHLTMYDDVTIPEPATLFDDYSTRSSAAGRQEMTIERHLYPAYDLKLDRPAEDDKTDANLWNSQYRRFTDEQRGLWDAAYGPKNKAFYEANLSGKELVRWKYQRYIKDYLRCIASVDDNIGRLLDYLDESGLARNTIVVYSSDQGFYLGDHGWYDKRWMYEESLRMPLIVRWPGAVRPGSENGHLVQNLDFAQTFLDMAGVPAPADMQGRSLVPLLRGRSPEDWRKSIYYHYREYPAWHMVHRHYGVRTDRYKLIRFYQIGEWELFDLQKDPNELHNRYDDPAYASVREELEAELERLLKQYNETPFGKWEQHYYDRVARFRKENIALANTSGNIVMVGSSHIEGMPVDRLFPGRRIANRGIASDRIGIDDRGILRRLDCSVFDCRPGFIILENGVNDLGELWRNGKPSIDEIEQCYREVVHNMRERLPGVPLLIVGLFPTRDKYAELVPLIVEFNTRLERIARDHDCPFLDVYKPFADDEGLLRKEFSREGLHLTEAGYQRWAELIEKALPQHE